VTWLAATITVVVLGLGVWLWERADRRRDDGDRYGDGGL